MSTENAVLLENGIATFFVTVASWIFFHWCNIEIDLFIMLIFGGFVGTILTMQELRRIEGLENEKHKQKNN